ncbi:MAG: NADH-quinone oxidoreductase subunit M [Puniceicoccales bacterium]|jgi:NADH-quinone oxidoreductase subunit M|nr:NADH-quinone oxidoreductase subunit M [Puniceicoccales bacterium]
MSAQELFFLAALATPFAIGTLLIALGRRLPAPSMTMAFLAGAGFLLPGAHAVTACAWFAQSIDPATGYAWVTTLPFGIEPIGISLTLALNGISLPLYTLAALVGAAAGIHALGSDVENKPAYLGLLLLMLGGMLAMFATMDVFFLYFFHEFTLIPAFILILRWGGLGRRTAAIQMVIYLTLGAMISLAGIILLVLKSGAGNFNLLALSHAIAASPIDATSANWIFGLLLFGFGILVSLFPFHSWAPPTYTEAPTPVSMLHAGVLKNFGLYGLIQLGALLVPAGLTAWADVLFWLAIGNTLAIGIVTLGQQHLKEMLSYSSVAHMGTCFLGIFAFSLSRDSATALGATVIVMFAHGLSTAALFSLSHSVQRRTGTLEFDENGGLIKRAPVLAAFFATAAMASIGLPGFAGFWGEMGVFVSLWKLPLWKLLLALCGLLISATYMLRAFAIIFLGKESENIAHQNTLSPIRDITWNERISTGILLAALLATGLLPRLITDNLNTALGGTP